MGETTLTVQQADSSDLSFIQSLLDVNDLPTQDVPSKCDCFYIGYVGSDPRCIGAVEVYGQNGLLRSVVVERSERDNGFGTALCNALEKEAIIDGVETLYLLTTTATDFFAGRGYTEIDRTAAPASIRNTKEFTDLCPSTATCMGKSL